MMCNSVLVRATNNDTNNCNRLLKIHLDNCSLVKKKKET